MNVALYGRSSRWAMTERDSSSLRQHTDGIEIGESAMRWDGAALTIDIEEVTFPILSRLRGRIIVRPRTVQDRTFQLDTAGRHTWWPIAPLSDVTVMFERPASSWHGTGYFDSNSGDAPLESAFWSWTWSRFHPEGRCRIFYDVIEATGEERRLSLGFDATGDIVEDVALPSVKLKSGWWGIERTVPADLGHVPTLVSTCEDAPFYTRSTVASRIDGVDAIGVHESLSLRRLRSPLVRLMLPFRMPRNAGRRR